MTSATLILSLACVFGFLMAWGVGANDVGNAMGTSVGSHSLTLRQAIVVAVIFEFLGSLLAGGEVTDTIRQGLIEPALLEANHHTLILGMMAALLASAIWLAFATRFGWPVSTSHTIVGAIVGFGTSELGVAAIQWSTMGQIAASWLLSPLMGGVLAYTLHKSILRYILNAQHPLDQAKKLAPFYIFFVGLIVFSLVLFSGIDHIIGYTLSQTARFFLSIILAAIIALIGKFLLVHLKLDPNADKVFHFANVEKIFGLLMLFTACAMAFAHGSNDVANAIGPLAAIAQLLQGGDYATQNTIPLWTLILGASGIVLGLVTYGHKVIATIGKGITELTPTRGFSATLAAATTVIIASGTGLPISTTHTIVGAVLGVGLAKGINALNLNVIRTILISWLITLPMGAVLAIIIFKVLRLFL